MNYNSDIITNYYIQRELYLKNAGEYKSKKGLRKSSEMLWGAITQTIKALAATADIRIGAHNQFSKFLREISTELNDTYYISEFLKMDRLQRNFYDEEISEENFEFIFDDALNYLSRLDELVKKG